MYDEIQIEEVAESIYGTQVPEEFQNRRPVRDYDAEDFLEERRENLLRRPAHETQGRF